MSILPIKLFSVNINIYVIWFYTSTEYEFVMKLSWDILLSQSNTAYRHPFWKSVRKETLLFPSIMLTIFSFDFDWIVFSYCQKLTCEANGWQSSLKRNISHGNVKRVRSRKWKSGQCNWNLLSCLSFLYFPVLCKGRFYWGTALVFTSPNCLVPCYIAVYLRWVIYGFWMY